MVVEIRSSKGRRVTERLATGMAKYRREFPFTRHTVFLNTAAFGPLPLRIKKMLDRFDRTMLELDDWEYDEKTFHLLDGSRALAARLVNARSDQVGFSFNTSFGLNICAAGLPWHPGDEVLLSGVDFPANIYTWSNLKRRGVAIRFLSRQGRDCIDPEQVEQSIAPRTKLLALSFVQYFNGYKNDLETLGEICRARNVWLVVDGTQGVGAEMLDVRKAQIDFLACGGQKWLLSAPGTGFFYISDRLREVLEPIFFSWLGVDWGLDFSDLQKHDLRPFASARRFEIGSYPARLVRHFHAALELILEAGVARIHEHNHALLDRLLAYLADSPYRLKSPWSEERRSSIVSFASRDNRRLLQFLRKRKISVALRERGIRVSPHFFNNAADMDSLIGALKQFQAKSR